MSTTSSGLNLLTAIISGSAASKSALHDDSAVKKADPVATVEAVRSAVEQLQSYVNTANRAVEFKIDSATGLTVVTVTDSKSGEVIRQIPSAEALWLAAHIGTKQSALVNTSA